MRLGQAVVDVGIAALRLGSVLLADCGSAMTTVALVERVGNHYRFVARGEALSTHRWPWWDLRVGVRQAVGQVEALVGRSLLGPDGVLVKPRTEDGDGVDAFVTVSSAGLPMQVVLAGLADGLSLDSARRALTSVPAQVLSTLALDGGDAGRDPQVRLQTLCQARPDLIVITGGTDGGAEQPVLDLVQLVDTYNRISLPGERPFTYYAGNARLAGELPSRFSAGGELGLTDNVRPGLEIENLQPLRSGLEDMYRDRYLAAVPGMSGLEAWAGKPAALAAGSFGQLVRYVGERYQLKVIGLDLGSSATVLAGCSQPSSDEGQAGVGFGVITRSDLGMGSSLPGALDQISLERVLGWMPYQMDREQARDALLNKALQPQSLAQSQEELLLEQGLARELVRQLLAGAREDWLQADFQWDLIIGTGRTLTRVAHPAQAALMLLDALQPVGVSKITLDTGGVANMMGALAAVHPLAAVEVVEHDALLTLGTAVALSGRGQPGEPALHLTIEYEDGQTGELDLSCGSLQVLPLKPGQRAQLELYPARSFDVGVGQPGVNATAEVEGGPVGIVVDARGRPLASPEYGPTGWDLVQGWMTDLRIGVQRREAIVESGTEGP